MHDGGPHFASVQSVRDFASAFLAKGVQLHVLINNAGVYCPPYGETKDGFENQFGVNYLSHFLLTHLLLDKLKESAPARIINVSSVAHSMANLDFDDLQTKEHPGSRFIAYSRSKLAQVMHAFKLQRLLDGTGVTISALHPGVVNTALWRELWGPIKYMVYGVGALFLKSPAQGAATTVWAATEDTLEGVGGKYYADRREATPSRQACDVEAQEKLWRVSLQLVGLDREEDERTED